MAGAPQVNLSAAEAAAFASLETDEEATTYYKPDIAELQSSHKPETAEIPSSVPPAVLQGDLSRPGDIHWIDGLGSSPPTAGPTTRPPEQPSTQPAQSSVMPAERRLRWVAVLVAVLLLAGIFLLSRMQ
jgi:hypothetical protein